MLLTKDTYFYLVALVIFVGVFSSINFSGNVDETKIELTKKQIYQNLQKTWLKSSGGNSNHQKKLSERNDSSILPENYYLLFDSGNKINNNNTVFYYAEGQNIINNSEEYIKIIQKDEIKHVENTMYLKNIIAKENELDSGIKVDNVVISFLNPNGDMEFYLNKEEFFNEGGTVDGIDANNIQIFSPVYPNKNIKLLVFEYYNFDTKVGEFKIHKDIKFNYK